MRLLFGDGINGDCTAAIVLSSRGGRWMSRGFEPEMKEGAKTVEEAR